jgi:hypothetical protein
MVRKPNQFRHQENGVTKIFLTQGKIALIDTRDYSAVCGYRWHAVKSSRRWYARAYVSRVGCHQQNICLHQLLLPCKRPREVDHRDGDGLNNRRSNLRRVTHQRNLWNPRKHLNTSSRFIGVYFASTYGKWRATLKINEKRIHLGWFDDEEAAHQARLAGERKYR